MNSRALVVPFSLLLLAGCVTEQKYDKQVQQTQKAVALEQQYQALNQQLQQEVARDQVQIKQLNDRLVVTFVDEILFASGSAEMNAKGRAVLNKAVPTLVNLTGHWIDVQGYTDNEPIGPALRGRYPSNWELSAARAADVVRYLQSQGVDPSNLVAEGFGQYQPVASNATPEGRAKNRRIDVVLRAK
ncbi:MAG TPA: flagellar motor protein MotB [Accumulibacter sp.]|uniref:OmpA/MotB family protein n=1 Tax=Accumulibacter sp. TaxID=2053492 RepID=UPI0025ECDEEC|nr:flagellar motor protein MotB [Accumulibacter sp.]MCM8599590.1 flagellar motor protein MotB [Accumulibacter sp.]MCM8663469.1 flagellar motor protein MotB [Accumulibacter sp.]HNC51013.1 flagellar motor protein MotB [Accumulibacter sp.]